MKSCRLAIGLSNIHISYARMVYVPGKTKKSLFGTHQKCHGIAHGILIKKKNKIKNDKTLGNYKKIYYVYIIKTTTETYRQKNLN